MVRLHTLRSSADFRRAARVGERERGDMVEVQVVDRSDGGPVRFGFAVGKAAGRATARNRIKRQLRAIAEAANSRVAGGLDVVLVASGSGESDFPALEAEIWQILDRLGALSGEPPRE